MTPTTFPQANNTYAKDQPGYLPLPAFVDRDDPTGPVVSCWRLTWRERLQVLVRGRLWLSVLAFHQPLQPLRLDVEPPFPVP